MDKGAASSDPGLGRFDLLSMAGIGRKKRGDNKYATFNRRMLAATVDSFFLLLVAPVFNRWFPIDMSAFRHPPENATPEMARHWMLGVLTDPVFISSWLTNMAAQLLVFCLFSGICWHYWSATPGKMLFRIKVVDVESEQPVTDRQILLRMAGYVISGLCLFLGFFWIGFDRRRQGWHDKLAHTAVVVIPWHKPVAG
ncbi:MAG: RDD family protein [Pseudomonadota bacterium]|nr:RDD family protein [Pseudomonadota bacterium]